MCNVCFKELRGWFRSFTRTEILLSLLQAILLVILVAFLVFLILHFLVCPKRHISNEISKILDTTELISTTEATITSIGYIIDKPATRPTKPKPTKAKTPATVKTNINCTWKVSQKTEANIHYYYPVTKLDVSKKIKELTIYNSLKVTANVVEDIKVDIATGLVVENRTTSESTEDDIYLTPRMPLNNDNVFDISDSEDVSEANIQHILALVKLKPPKDIIFGCILTIVHEYWVLTAASCLEAIEEVDSLDDFVMMEGYGGDYKKNHAVEDVQIHPMY